VRLALSCVLESRGHSLVSGSSGLTPKVGFAPGLILKVGLALEPLPAVLLTRGASSSFVGRLEEDTEEGKVGESVWFDTAGGDSTEDETAGVGSIEEDTEGGKEGERVWTDTAGGDSTDDRGGRTTPRSAQVVVGSVSTLRRNTAISLVSTGRRARRAYER